MKKKLVIGGVCLMLLIVVSFGVTQERIRRVTIEQIMHEVLVSKGSVVGWHIVRSPLSGRCYELLNGSKSMAMAEVPCDGWSKK